jgi:hypothetical protein
MPVAVLILGTLTIVYTYRGGMRAVVWTEILQAAVYLVGGLSAIVLLGQLVAGGWGEIVHRAAGANKLQLIDTYTGFDRPHTVFAGLLGGAFLAMASHGADQLIVQRLLSSRTLKDARVAVIGSGVTVIIQFALFLMVGIGLWALYNGQAFPTPDAIFPTFIIEKMPHGLVGLLLAAILAATMSTHSGAINSLAAAATHDIYLPLTGRAADDPGTLRVGKLFALMWGIVLTGGALLFPEEPADTRGRRGAVDRVVHVRGPARRLLPRNILEARASGRCHHRHVDRHCRDGPDRICQTALKDAGVSCSALELRRESRRELHRVALVRVDRHHDHPPGRRACFIGDSETRCGTCCSSPPTLIAFLSNAYSRRWNRRRWNEDARPSRR